MNYIQHIPFEVNELIIQFIIIDAKIYKDNIKNLMLVSQIIGECTISFLKYSVSHPFLVEDVPNLLVDCRYVHTKNISLINNYTHITHLNVSNCRLTTLENLPNSLYFLDCSYNKITSLKHCPTNLHTLDCSMNLIRSFEHSSTTLHTLYCSYNKITSFEYCPNNLHTLDCNMNQITSFKYCPNLSKMKHFDYKYQQNNVELPDI